MVVLPQTTVVFWTGFSGLRTRVRNGVIYRRNSASGLRFIASSVAGRRRVFGSLNDSATAPPQARMIDGTIIRAHHPAAGAKGGLAKKVLAVQKVASRPGYIMIANARGLPMRAEITDGEVSDCKGFDLLMDGE